MIRILTGKAIVFFVTVIWSFTTYADNVKDSAERDKKANEMSAIMSGLTGGYLVYSGKALLGTPSAPAGHMMISMGLISFVQAYNNYEASLEAGASEASVSDFDYSSSEISGGGEDSEDVVKNTKIGESLAAQKRKAVEALAGLGYEAGKDGSIKFPDGSVIPASGISPGGAMGKKLGLSTADRKKVSGLLKKAIKKADIRAKVIAVGIESNSGGRGFSGTTAFENELDYDLKKSKNKKTKKDRKLASVAGMYRTHKGEKIGVAGDNIFEMMKRRYKLKKQQKAFIE